MIHYEDWLIIFEESQIFSNERIFLSNILTETLYFIQFKRKPAKLKKDELRTRYTLETR